MSIQVAKGRGVKKVEMEGKTFGGGLPVEGFF